MTTQIKILIGALVLIGVLGAAWLVEKTWADSITQARSSGEKAGREGALRETSERDNVKLLAALKRVKELEEEKRKLEQQAAEDLLQAVNQHQEEIRNADAKNSKLAASARSLTLRLRDAEGKAGSGCPGSSGGAGSEVASTTTGDNARSGCELSAKTSGDLWSEAERADRVAGNLKLCQKTVLTYLKACKN